MKKLEVTHFSEKGEPVPTSAELFRELDRPARADERATFDIERYFRHARALERLCAAAFETDGLEKLLPKLIELFVEAAGSDVGVLRLREGEQLRSRAAVGLEDEVAAGFSSALPSLSHNGHPPVVLNEVVKSEPLLAKQMRAHHSLSLLDGEALVGVVVLGWGANRDLSDDEREMLAVLAAHAAAAIRRAQADEALRAALTARDEVLSVVAHDLKNPVNVIAITANAMLQRAEESSARRPIERILRGVERAERLLRDLLEVNAIEAGRLSLDKRRLEPADPILAALESQQGVAEDASVIIACDLAPELPEIEADEERLLEVLENLIGNAVKFTAPGGSVTVGASRRGNEILIWVKDNGSGIPAEELPHVFDRFWHAKKAKRRGTGLGLTICKGIIEAHRGRMWLESKPGEGTTVFFTLPIAAAASVRSEGTS